MTEQAEEQKYGLEGIEQSQGYTPLVHAVPDEPAEPAIDTDSASYRHLTRPPEPPPVHRDYFDVQSGEATPSNQTLEVDRASRDLSEIRTAERAALEQQRNADLNQVLDFLAAEEAVLKDAATPRPVEPVAEEQQAQPELQQPDFTPQPEFEVPSGLHPEIAQALQSPKVRSLLEHVNLQFEQTKSQYAAATAQLAQEAVATLAAAVPELAGMNPQEAAGALRLIAQQNPQRAEAIRQLVGRTQAIVAAQQQQLAQAQAQQRQQYQENLAAYADQEGKRYETLIARDRSPEQIKALRENVFPMVERHYGIPQASMRDLYSGAAPVSGAEFMRSSAFQLMLSDALSWRMSREAVGRAVNRPIPNVQRPGSPEAFQTRTQAALAEAQSKLKPSMSPREAANFLIAKRAAAR
jgi:hypothetical protein